MTTLNELTETAIALCIKIHKTLGSGLFESVYETVLCYELSKNNIPFVCQHPFPVYYESIKMEAGFKADIIIEDKLFIEVNHHLQSRWLEEEAQRAIFQGLTA